MKKAKASGIYGMKRFVRKLKHDLAAVKNALRESWSNGPVEGHINRLKTLKRQMYGRAGFELLRARLLPMACGSPCTVIEEEPQMWRSLFTGRLVGANRSRPRMQILTVWPTIETLVLRGRQGFPRRLAHNSR
jgi:hypothetical protein